MPDRAPEEAPEGSLLTALTRLDRRASRFHRALLAAMVTAGLLCLLAATLAASPARFPLAALGLFILSLLPMSWRELIKRRQRLQALSVLARKWAEVGSVNAKDQAAELRRLIHRLYGLPN